MATSLGANAVVVTRVHCISYSVVLTAHNTSRRITYAYVFFYWSFQNGSFVIILLCSCVGGFVCCVCFVIVCPSSLLLSVPREECASWLWHLFPEYFHLQFYIFKTEFNTYCDFFFIPSHVFAGSYHCSSPLLVPAHTARLFYWFTPLLTVNLLYWFLSPITSRFLSWFRPFISACLLYRSPRLPPPPPPPQPPLSPITARVLHWYLVFFFCCKWMC